MDDDELAFCSAKDLADLVRRREVSPIEIVQRVLERAEAHQPDLNAFITIAHAK